MQALSVGVTGGLFAYGLNKLLPPIANAMSKIGNKIKSSFTNEDGMMNRLITSKAGSIKLGKLFGMADEGLEGAGNATKADFYVTPKGDAIPSTGYRYMDSKYASQTISSQSAPGSYIGFTKFESASAARSAYQVAPEWSNCELRGEFDTLQVIDDIYVPKTYGNTGDALEPIAVSYPQYGTGGYYQLKTDSILKFNNVKVIGK